MDGVGVFQILSDTGLPISMATKASGGIGRELTLSAICFDDDPDATLKALKDDKIWLQSMDMAKTLLKFLVGGRKMGNL